jgi:ribonucleotide reductase beta subunit family protein with ferritin-like domain
VRAQEPDLWDAELEAQIVEMLHEAVDPEARFAEDLLSGGLAGLSLRDVSEYLGYVADSGLQRLGMSPAFNAKNPISFMDLQDVQELTNFFEPASRPTRALCPERWALAGSSKLRSYASNPKRDWGLEPVLRRRP